MDFDLLGNALHALGDIVEKTVGAAGAAAEHTSQAADANTLRDLGLLGGGILAGRESIRYENEKQKRQNDSRQHN